MQVTFRVSGVEYGHRNYAMPHDEDYVIEADSVGDALNELVNRSGMWETLDHTRPFTIEVIPS